MNPLSLANFWYCKLLRLYLYIIPALLVSWVWEILHQTYILLTLRAIVKSTKLDYDDTISLMSFDLGSSIEMIISDNWMISKMYL